MLQVQVRNGDAFIAENRLPPPGLVKIDVEGYEPFVLRGLAATIREHRPPILMELSDASRNNLTGEDEFRSLFYPDAVFFEVSHTRAGQRFKLKPFQYKQSGEVLIIPESQLGYLG